MKLGFNLKYHSSITKTVILQFGNNHDEEMLDFIPLLRHPVLIKYSTFKRVTVLID